MFRGVQTSQLDRGEYIYTAVELFSSRALLNWFFKSSLLKQGLESRPDADQLNRLNLIPAVALGVSPRIAEKSVRLEKEIRKDLLAKMLKIRPNADQMSMLNLMPAIAFGVSPRLAQKSLKLSAFSSARC